MQKPIRMLLADDHLVVRMGLAAVLEFDSNLKVIATAENGEQAVELHRLHRPDIVLMDLRMPGLDGIEATKKIRAEFPAARIIMLTTYNAEEDVLRVALRVPATASSKTRHGPQSLTCAAQ